MTSNLSSDPLRAETRMTMAIFPANANHFGTLFGGQAMAWMDQAAFIGPRVGLAPRS
jgi:acyl-CoA hydrolase